MPVKKHKLLPIILLGVACVCALGIFLSYRYIPTSKKISYRTAMDLSDRDYFVVGDIPITECSAPVIKSGVLYIPVDFIKSKLDPYIFWDEKADRLSITTENKVIRMNTDNLNYYVNNTPMRLNLPVYKIDGNAYLPKEFTEEFYNAEITYSAESGFAVVDLKDKSKVICEITAKKAEARLEPIEISDDIEIAADTEIPTDKKSTVTIKSPIVMTLAKGDEVVLLETYDKESKFTKIRSADGIVAYVLTTSLGEPNELPASPKPPEPVLQPQKTIDGKITLLWDQILKVEDNSKPEKYEPYSGLTVISPTWFSFDEEKLNGDIINIADKAYVDWAHENDYQVWALLSDNFNSEINHAVLSDTNNREHVIKQLLALAAMYNLDGINIDFEALRKVDAEYYLQFLRELGPLLHEQGASLSVDMFVPTYTQYYNRTEVGRVVDYICVMTYDEHYSGSETSGPVASLPFVDRGIADTLKEAPKEKVLMGMPFYVRVWREVLKDGKNTHTIKNYTMEKAYSIFVENGAKFTWLPEIGSYYGEYSVIEEGESVTYRVWLEDLRSIEEKLALADMHGVAGVACWKRGLEADGVWEMVKEWRDEQ